VLDSFRVWVYTPGVGALLHNLQKSISRRITRKISVNATQDTNQRAKATPSRHKEDAMRKVIYAMSVSIDGFIETANGEISWSLS